MPNNIEQDQPATPPSDRREDECKAMTLFSTFFKIGAVTLGGGYAMLPYIQQKVVDEHRWLEEEKLLDLIAIAQSCPGVFAINISVFIGYKLKKKWGAFCAALGTALPSFLIILAIAIIFRQFMEWNWVAAKINLANCWIPIVSALLIWLLHVNPIWIIIAAGAGGYVYGKVLKT